MRNPGVPIPLAIFLCLVLLIAMVLRFFVFKTRWYLPELMFIMILCSFPTGYIFVNAHAHGQLKNPNDALTFAFYSFIVMIPIFVGAWWGLHTAERMNEHRTLRRVGLIFAGFLFLTGVASIIPAVLGTAALLNCWANSIYSSDVILSFVGFWTAVVIGVIPAILIERRCRSLDDTKREARQEKWRFRPLRNGKQK
jgi:hypothetical protein